MKTLWAWSVFAFLLGKYLLSRMGLARRPTFLDHEEAMYRVTRQMFRWRKRVRVVGAEHCPKEGPILFSANHHKLDDPIDLWPGVYWTLNKQRVPFFLMRDDFFQGRPWDWLPIHPNHLCEMCGDLLISRDDVRWSQLRPMVRRLAASDIFILFPGRTRSRTGAWFEYRDWVEAPGSTGFVIGLTQRRYPGLRLAAAPIARTWHPVRRTSTIAFGPPLYQEPDADRAAQRALDEELLRRIGVLVEVHGVHLAGTALWMHALHHGDQPLSLATLVRAAADWAAQPGVTHVHPALLTDPAGEMAAAADYFARRGLVQRQGDILAPCAARLLAAPPWDGRYLRQNPAKYYANQVLHLPGVAAWAEALVLP